VSIAVITDSAAALPPELARLDVGVVEMRIDRAPKLSTSAPAPGAFDVAIRERLDHGARGVLVVTLTSSLSSSYHSAIVAARAFGDRAAVVDSRTAAGGQALVVLAAAEAARCGQPLDVVAGSAEDVAARVRLLGTVPDLRHLVASGRVPAIAGWAGRTFGLHPLFELHDGQVHRMRPARSRAAAVDRMIAAVRRSRVPSAALRLVALHAQAADEADALLARVDDELAPATAMVGEFGPVMVVHTGPGILGLAWWWDTKQPRP
jgi:DegV family protein with EDD domain